VLGALLIDAATSNGMAREAIGLRNVIGSDLAALGARVDWRPH